MAKISVGDQATWCTACGNTTGVCASSTATSTGSGSSPSSSTTGGAGGLTKAQAGVIGAMVTLAVIVGLEALILLMGGFRIAKKGTGIGKKGAGAGAATTAVENVGKA